MDKTIMDTRILDIKCYWLYGESGAGKSHMCTELAKKQRKEGEHIYRHNNGNFAWWDGYSSEEIVIMEELRRNKIKAAGGLAQLLVYLDKYPVLLPVKGSFVRRNYHTVYINTAQDPITFFTYKTNDGDIVDESVAQLIRRVDKIIEFKIITTVVNGERLNNVILIDHTEQLKRLYTNRLDNVQYAGLDQLK